MNKKVNKTSNFIKNKFDFVLFIVVLVLLATGIVMVLSASAPTSLAENGKSYTYVVRQLIFGIVGVIAMIIISKIDYHIYKKFYWPAYIVANILLILVIVPGLGSNSSGATRWLELGPLRFQPSEVAKVLLIIFYAGYLADHKSEITDFWRGFIRPLAFLIPPFLILFFVQNHLSVCIVIAAIVGVMMIAAGIRMLYVWITGAVGIAGIAGLLVYMQAKDAGGFRLSRILSFLDPWSDPTGDGWQVIQSFYAIGSGGLFGVGLRRK